MLFLADFSVIRPDFGLFFWSVLIFLIFWFMMSRLAFKPISEALAKRENDIQDALDQAEKARQEMSNLKAENEQILAQAREERAQILKEANDVKNGIISEARDKAKEEANRIVTNAKLEIENQRKAAVTDLKNEAGRMAVTIAEKILRKQLSGDSDQQAYVDSLVDEIKLN